jgi:Fic family protein
MKDKVAINLATYPAKKAAKKGPALPPDRGEATAEMEPLLIGETSRFRGPLTDLVIDLVQKSARFRGSLPSSLLNSLADLVRSMNCYYSNLIEGHNTHPVDIERALKNDYSKEPHKRNLQLEAKAHITVQKWIDGGGLRNGRAVSEDGICEIHRRFCAELPEGLLWVEDPDTTERIEIVAGELRRRDVKVGNHVPISPGAVPRFLTRFEHVYGHLGKTDAILGAAPGHHRLLWIHPFLDSNGRVARLMSHAVLLETLDTGAVWSVARGLARRVAEYKRHLAACDSPRRNDLDGRGALSEEALAAFTKFFLEVCIDQVEFMEGLMQPDALRARILLWAEEQIKLSKLPPSSGRVLEAVLYRGNLPRSGVASVVGASTRTATRIVSALTEAGVLTSDTPYAPVRLVFPAALAERWMPGLFPEKQE